MSRIARDAGFVVLLLAMAASLSWFFSKVRQTGVESYLGLLGNSLFAMVPDGEDKDQLKKKYGRFLAEVAKRNVPPEQVEHVAASILNLSNASQGLTAAQAETLLFLTEMPLEFGKGTAVVVVPPLPAPPGAVRVEGDSAVSHMPPLVAALPAQSTPEKWDAMQERIKTMYEFNYRFKGELVGLTPHPAAVQRLMHFSLAPDMKITVVINDSLKQALLKRKQLAIARELERLEKEKRLVWQQNFSAQRRLDQERLKHELQRLRELDWLGEPEAMKALSSLHGLQTLSPKSAADSADLQAELKKALEETKRALRQMDSMRAGMEKN